MGAADGVRPLGKLGYRKGSVPANDLEHFWLPADRRWNELIASATIELLINPRQSITAPISVIWGGDGSSELLPWPATSRQAPQLLHDYSQRADVSVQVQLSLLIATLPWPATTRWYCGNGAPPAGAAAPLQPWPT